MASCCKQQHLEERMRWQMALASAVTSRATKLSMQMTVSADSKKSLLAPLTRTCR